MGGAGHTEELLRNEQILTEDQVSTADPTFCLRRWHSVQEMTVLLLFRVRVAFWVEDMVKPSRDFAAIPRLCR